MPPGDLRMALAALASDSPHGRLWATIFQHRFGGSGALAGPSDRQPVAGRAQRGAGRSGGRARRARPDPRGQGPGVADVPDRAADRGRRRGAGVRPADEPGDPRAGGRRDDAGQGAAGAAAAGRSAGDPAGGRRDHGRADLVVLGPGSWFTSVIPHVLVPGLAAALQATPARRALVLNLAAEPGETAGFSAERHLACAVPACPGVHGARDRRRRRPGAGRARARTAAAHREPSQCRGEVCRRGQTWYTST